ncbi:hypothetical protein GYMLUDRAFT_50815 [Collybiopsis luxurians FD-317 M1]|uniref:Uncharacterized protein n=1 Tax=Collybiopsis luxurians FD-317 M1 TaxID=944289 RepID=A0A0D0BNG1_9AGAR|nr:hypothetical protein GYMLUDRAFT_51466 [Collybiopsis luxurians FD-317 M1]KIK51014.1 hypothetical protein GYMLUDRAFT_50815 [Collybiopsis luxurians FD-317 M1]
MTDGQTITKEFTETYADSMTVRPGMKMTATVTLYKVVAKDVKWTGKMTVTYAWGGTQTFDVDGTFDSVSCTKQHINLNAVPL